MFGQNNDKANDALKESLRIEGEILEVLNDYEDIISENRKNVTVQNLRIIDLFKIKIRFLIDNYEV